MTAFVPHADSAVHGLIHSAEARLDAYGLADQQAEAKLPVPLRLAIIAGFSILAWVPIAGLGILLT